jgi:hypothetical protein
MAKNKLFTDEEIEIIHRAAAGVWQECGCDVLSAIAEEKGKSAESITVSRSLAMEIALDAGRTEEMIKRNLQWRNRSTPKFVLADDFWTRYESLDYKALIKLVKPAFPYTRYGM